jgi:hypothetical protein
MGAYNALARISAEPGDSLRRAAPFKPEVTS